MLTALENHERRALGNLTIPRNIEDLTHQLRIDPWVRTLKEEELFELLGELEDRGWVVNLGDGHTLEPGKLAAKVDSHAKALSMPDEKAKNFEERLSIIQRRWRLVGDMYILTQEGLDKLHEPVLGTGDVASLVTLQQLIDQEAQRVYKGDPEKLKDNPQGTISTKLLESEFKHWINAVMGDLSPDERKQIRLPVSGGAGYGDATELLILDPENAKGSAYTETAPWHMALLTTVATDADTGTTIIEANYTGYARKTVAAADMNSAAAGSAANANAIIFAACTSGTSTVIGFAKCVALTVGRLIKYGTCASTTVSVTQTPAQFAAGAFTTTLD